MSLNLAQRHLGPAGHTRSRLVNGTAAVLIMAVTVALATGRTSVGIALASVPLGAFCLVCAANATSRIPLDARPLVTVWVLLVLSTLVWRSRTTTQLNNNPVDSAAGLRIALVGVAGLVAFAVLTSRQRRLPPLPTPIRWFLAYLLVAFVSALTSPLPAQALYRVFEFVIGLAGVAFLLLRIERARRAETAMKLVQVTLSALIVIVWVEAVLSPTRGWQPTPGLAPYTLHGFFPDITSNTVGTLGALLAIAALSATVAKTPYLWFPRISLAAGVATLLASQYRTGVIGFLIAAPFALAPRYRLPVLGLVTFLIVTIVFASSGGRVVRTVQSGFAKGHPQLVSNLDSRTTYWHAAAPLIRERPFIGWGLDVGSRRALLSIGNDQASTIHGTWFEALLGTGALGTVLLALAFLSLLRGSWQKRSRPLGAAVLGMTVFLLTRSVTGTSIELFSLTWMIFAALALCVSAIEPRADESSAVHASSPPLKSLLAGPPS